VEVRVEGGKVKVAAAAAVVPGGYVINFGLWSGFQRGAARAAKESRTFAEAAVAADAAAA